MDEREKIVDEQQKLYLDNFQENVTGQLDSLKELILSKLDPIVEKSRENAREIKDHSTEINNLKVEITALKGSVLILEDNKQSQKDKDSLTPKNKGNLITIIALCVTTFIGFLYFISDKLG